MILNVFLFQKLHLSMEKESIQFMTTLEDENRELKEEIAKCKILNERISAQKTTQIQSLKDEISQLKLKLTSKEVEYRNIFDTINSKAALRVFQDDKPQYFGPIENYFKD